MAPFLMLAAFIAAGSPAKPPKAVTVDWTAPLLSQLGFPTVAPDGALIDIEVCTPPELAAQPPPAPPKRRIVSLADRCRDGVAQTVVQGDSLFVLCFVHASEEGPMARHAAPPSTLTALSLPSGKRRWSIDVPSTEGQMACSASSCVLQTMTWLAAYDTRSGRRRWDTGGLGDAIVGGDGSYDGLATTDAEVFTVAEADTGETKLVALNRSSGRVMWRTGASEGESLLGTGTGDCSPASRPAQTARRPARDTRSCRSSPTTPRPASRAGPRSWEWTQAGSRPR